MKSFFVNKKQLNEFCLLLTIIIFKCYFYNCEIYDDFHRNNIETGDYDLLDVTDNYNLKLVVTTSKNIYTGIPPVKKDFTLTANLINSTSILTINQNYLLAACLQDSLLTVININTGASSSLINYNEINSNPQL